MPTFGETNITLAAHMVPHKQLAALTMSLACLQIHSIFCETMQEIPMYIYIDKYSKTHIYKYIYSTKK